MKKLGADILKIGYQDRPKLFELNIRKRSELASCVVEIDERMAATGEVLRAPEKQLVRGQLGQVRDSGVEAVAICLLHAYVNPAHEEIVRALARSEKPFTAARRSDRERAVVPGLASPIGSYFFASAIVLPMPPAQLHSETTIRYLSKSSIAPLRMASRGAEFMKR